MVPAQAQNTLILQAPCRCECMGNSGGRFCDVDSCVLQQSSSSWGLLVQQLGSMWSPSPCGSCTMSRTGGGHALRRRAALSGSLLPNASSSQHCTLWTLSQCASSTRVEDNGGARALQHMGCSEMQTAAFSGKLAAGRVGSQDCTPVHSLPAYQQQCTACVSSRLWWAVT